MSGSRGPAVPNTRMSFPRPMGERSAEGRVRGLPGIPPLRGLVTDRAGTTPPNPPFTRGGKVSAAND